ncbi:hypothetical protein ACIPX0_12355 [Streptomyces sp. NPDC090075]|uniref:hypothetical protein n=1 Tax=Streptomyces sp. NPDC090075 TaxID=3365937 RepID=UPI0037FD006C
MKNERRPLPGTNRQGAEESVDQNACPHCDTAGWDFVASTAVCARDPFWHADHGYIDPCGEFSVMICGALRRRLERAARLGGVAPETMINAILAEALGGGLS